MAAKKATDKKAHEFCVQQITNAEEQVEQLEKRLEAALESARKADDLLLKERAAWKDEKYELTERIKKLEEEVKHERRRASQALDVAESTSDAAGGIGRLLRQIVDDGVMDQLRLAQQEREQKARESMRHRRLG